MPVNCLPCQVRDLFLFSRAQGIQSGFIPEGPRLKQARDMKVYIEYLLISRLVITVSFSPAVWSSNDSLASAPTAHLGGHNWVPSITASCKFGQQDDEQLHLTVEVV